MPCMEFEPTIPASKRAKTVHALDSSATVTGNCLIIVPKRSTSLLQSPIIEHDLTVIHFNQLDIPLTHQFTFVLIKHLLYKI
jgi:hypothetical protein